jgi:GGDEF domain-containing protein
VEALSIGVGDREPLRVSASVGAALYPADGGTLDALFAAADIRMAGTSAAARARRLTGESEPATRTVAFGDSPAKRRDRGDRRVLPGQP